MIANQNGPYRELGATGLACHPLGFGCYRISQGSEEHEASLRAYLDRGGNLIDTSANYTDGLSESLIGHILRDYPREKAIVVTKGGYIQGQNMALAQRHNFPEVVYYGEEIWHCIHPEFLKTQVQRSLERMRLNNIDIYLLHNPEYFLTEKERHGGPAPEDLEEFYRRIREAFMFLESQVEKGTLKWYGISSNNYGLPSSQSTMISVHRCLQQTRSFSEDHHFRVIQLPMNLYEPGGALEKNNEGKTVLEFCHNQGIGVLINRPLNAFFKNRMIRLADFVKPGQEAPALQDLLRPLRVHESRLAKELQIALMGGGTKGLADVIEEIIPQLESRAHWDGVVGQCIIRPLQSWLAQQSFSRDARGDALRRDFIELINPLFEDIARFLSFQEQSVSDSVRDKLYQAGYPKTRDSLSRMGLNILACLPGLHCVLNGMRRLEYVDDALGVPDLPAVDGIGILTSFHSQISSNPWAP